MGAKVTKRNVHTDNNILSYKKRKYVYEAKKAGEKESSTVRSGICSKSDGKVHTAVNPLQGSRSGERKYIA